MRQATLGDGSRGFESPVLAKNGGRLLFRWDVIHPGAGDSALGQQFLVIGEDITERNRINEDLKRERAFADAMLNSVPGLLYLFDDKGNFVWWNKRLEEVSGYTPEELRQIQPLDRFAEEEKPAVAAAIRRIFESGAAEYEGTLITKHGRKLTTLLTGVRLYIGGRPHFVGTGIDLTERKKVEHALKEREESSYRQLEELNLVYRYAPVGLAVLDRDFRYVRINERLANWNGRPVKEHIGRTIGEMIPSLAPDPEKFLTVAFEKGEPVLDHEIQGKLPGKDEVRYFQVSYFPLRTVSGKIDRILVSVTDISEHKQYESALLGAKDAAESASRIRTEFLDIAAHELRTPLTPLMLLIQSARTLRSRDETVSDEILQRMQRQVQRLAGLVNDLLDVSRLERGALVLRRAQVELNSIVSECVEDFRRQAPSRRIELDTAGESVMIEADPYRLQQVLANFLDNALKYAPNGGPIEVKVSVTRERVRVSVTDHGPGIPKEQQDALFTRFFRVSSDATMHHPGLGLGLYISRRIMEEHGGSIGLHCEVGRGCTFYFELTRTGR